MASIDYDLLSGVDGTYAAFRFDVFSDLFGKNFKPYVDATGTPRIGPSIDLATYLTEAATAIIGSAPSATLLADLADVVAKSYASGDSQLLRNRLDAVMQDWRATSGDAAFPKSFALADSTQALALIEDAFATVESALAAWDDIGMPYSEERAVVASLYHDGVDIDGIMTSILTDGDRLSAWLEIRYIDRTELEPSRQEVARHYYQSARFELFDDPASVSLTEANAAGQEYTRLRSAVLDYERGYDPEDVGIGAAAKGGRDGIADFLQPAIATLADYYGATVGRAEELLFASGRVATFYGDNPEDDFNSAKNNDDFIICTLTFPTTVFAGGGNDVVVALGGDDTVQGGAGNDNLYGGTGNDSLLGGNGNDRLWGGGGTDTLTGGDGNDTYILGGDSEVDPASGGSPDDIGTATTDTIVEAKGGGRDTVVVQVQSGDFNLRQIEAMRFANGTGGTYTVSLNEFDAFTLSSGDDDLTLVINRLQKTPIDIKTGGGADTIRIEFAPGVDPSQVLDGKGMTARFRFTDLSGDDVIDLTSIGIKDIISGRDHIDVDQGYYLLAPGAKLDLMDGNKIDKTYNNYTDNWFVVKCGDDTPFGPEFIGDVHRGDFLI
jgi:hypothetical protein